MSEDWRILRALGLYRLLLDSLLLILFETNIGKDLFAQIAPTWFRITCIVYALAALMLLVPIQRRQPRIEIQAPLHCAVDVAAIISLLYAAGGLGSRLGILLITPVVGCAMVLQRRWAMLLPFSAMAVLFTEEVVRASPHYSTSDLSGTILLGLILLGSTFGANTVAQRARQSEALAARVGSEFDSLSQLNQRIIENLATGVLVVDEQSRAHLLNDAARQQLGARRNDAAIELSAVFPALDRVLQEWRVNPHLEPAPVVPRGGQPELLPRILRLNPAGTGSTLILLDETARLREQAQQMKLAALGRLSASIAHEIRNPLSAIHQAAQLLGESEQVAAADHKLVSIIERHTARIDKIINDVLNLSRRREAAPLSIELGKWLQRAVDTYSEGHPERRPSFELLLHGETLRVRFDPGQLQQILFNLWDNSFEHSGRPASTVQVRLQSGLVGTPGQPYLEVSDNGSGIPTEMLDRVFEPFFTTAHQGTGLGLYLARELCEYNQARLEYLRRQTGACFRLIFAGAGDFTE
jgi:two-component system sensor histidine kinase PilS (NtrC family)